MLDTLIDIGKTLRNSDVGKVRYHRYFKAAPLNDEKKKIKVGYWFIPVDENFEIQFDRKGEIIDQNLIKNNLFYLTYKASETSPENKYIFGDIQYGTDKDGKEIGFYKLGNSEKKGLFGLSSFGRGNEDAKQFAGTIIEKFRASFENQKDEIESFLREQGQNQFVYLHFDFGGKSWYQFEDELKMINNALLNYFIEKQNGVFVLRNFIYKTLIKSVSSLPDFSEKNTFKTKAFNNSEEVLDLIYSLDYSKKALISERDIKIIVLPKVEKIMDKPNEIEAERLTAEDIIDFFEKNQSLKKLENKEKQIDLANQFVQSETDEFETEPLFSAITENASIKITQFDFIFSKRGEKGKDDDLLEISGVRRSFLNDLYKRIKQKKNSQLLQERRKFYPTKNKQYWGYDVMRSFLNILGDVTTDKKKYQSHLFKVLPQIYAGNYYRDDVILPAFIEKVEYNIRNTETGKTADYNLLKYDYYFLVLIRNKMGGKIMDNVNEMKDSLNNMKNDDSYKAGMLLGKMAKAIGRGKDPKIRSFEKNYVGLLSRRITDKQGLINLANFVNEKLAIHDVAYTDLKQASVSLAQLVGEMKEKNYRKNYCAFGFFESYYGYQENETTEQNQESENQEENQ